MTCELVMFDLDGTLVDTASDFYWVITRMCTERNAPTPAREVVEAQASNGSKAMLMASFDLSEDDPNLSQMVKEFLALYAEHLSIESQLYPGIPELLTELETQGIPWGVATNKPERFTLPLLQALELNPACIVCPENVSEKKPHPESLVLANKLTATRPSATLFIGDHIRDIECGKQSGAITISAAYGYIEPESPPESWNADYIVSSADEIFSVIAKHWDL